MHRFAYAMKLPLTPNHAGQGDNALVGVNMEIRPAPNEIPPYGGLGLLVQPLVRYPRRCGIKIGRFIARLQALPLLLAQPVQCTLRSRRDGIGIGRIR